LGAIGLDDEVDGQAVGGSRLGRPWDETDSSRPTTERSSSCDEH